MIFETRLTEKEMLVEINQYGKSIHVLKAAPVTRISVFKAGEKILDTVVWQGMALGGIEFDQIIVTSDTPQEIAIWAARTPFDFKQVSTRQQTILGSQKFIGNGVYQLLENDPSRIVARLECNSDIWVGGQDLRVVEGVVQNGRKYKANQEFELTAYGDVNCWITDNAEVKLYDNVAGDFAVSVPYTYGQNITRTRLENLGAPYFDVIIPDRMHNVPFKIDVEMEVVGGEKKSQLTVFYTVGDPTTERLEDMGWLSGGPFEGANKWEGGSPIALSAGAHRFFVVEQISNEGYSEGDVTTMRINYAKTKNEVYAIGGICQIMQERA